MPSEKWDSSLTDSDDSDFDELDEPDTGEFLESTVSHGVLQTGLGQEHGDLCVGHTLSGGVSFDASRKVDLAESKIIPFVTIHKNKKGFEHIRPECWMKLPVTVKITDVEREEHPHRTRKAFNPNLYTIEVSHGAHTWKVYRRYKHFDSLHKALRLFRARYTLPMPSKQYREKRQSIKEDRKERKKQKQKKKISKFPKKPEFLVGGDPASLEKRSKHLEQYLQTILESKWYRNHSEVLKFLEVCELSFVNQLGLKWKEGEINKCSGGRRISIGCCGCLKKFHAFGRWSDRWLIVKDTFISYIRPSDGIVCDVMLMDSDFRVESGMSATGAHHGLQVTNLSRCLLAKCGTNRNADEWVANIKEAADTTGLDFTEQNRFNSFAPVRENSYARWFIDGSSYFEAVADAIEKAKEEIFITDWWLSPEIYLKRMVTDREKWRLDEVLGRKAKQGVKVFVLLYKELEIALTIDSHYSKYALINKCPENIKVIRHPDHVAGSNRVLLWGHHEKLVVIDQKTAFVGGIDLCYGRWDDDKHRMIDLGSVTYTTLPDTNAPTDNHQNAQQTSDLENGSVQKNSKKLSPNRKVPSTIIEASETSLSDIALIDETPNIENLSENLDIEKDESVNDLSNDKQVFENIRRSMCSDKDYGSNDLLTENDSLENNGKVTYTNVVADVMIHSHLDQVPNQASGDLDRNSTNENSHSHLDQVQKQAPSDSDAKLTNESLQPSDSQKCNKNNSETDANVNSINNGPNSARNGPNSTSNGTNSTTNGPNSDLDIPNKGSNISKGNKQGPENGVKGTDLNENQTKASVRFREGDSVIEDEIVAEKASHVDAMPFGKKDAAQKRESWASRKLKKTFGLKKEEDDQCDGKDSDSDDSPKTRRKWRMVLNIKKLEHAGKRSEDEEKMPPESPYSKDLTKSPHHSLSTRIRQSMPFRTQRRHSDDDMYFNLYPWKRRSHRREDGSKSVMVTSVMRMDHDPESELDGLKGQSKLWIGKDYINFIHKDPVDMRNPFEDSEKLSSLGQSKLWIGKDYANDLRKEIVEIRNPFEDFIKRDETPRMPWHDIASVVYGKAARDVARHFIRRWNFCKTEKFKKNKKYPLLMPKSYAKCEVSPAIKEITYQVKSQVLRSVCGWSAGVQEVEKSIHDAIIHKIETAKHYIYFENQFFISQIADKSQVKNDIGEALLKRIEKAYRNNETFRVYVVLPLLPAFEGEIGANGGYAIQAVTHWNYKSISKGPHSLWHHLSQKVDDPKKYVIFCGLRTHAELKGKLVTELVYVHSKLMIIDDDTVIIGSANINDRSLLGTRDSEVCVMYEDVQKFPVKMAGKEHMAGNFAASIRRTLFREHLGIEEHDNSIDISDPIGDHFWKNVWFKQATINTTVYFKYFPLLMDPIGDHFWKNVWFKQATINTTVYFKVFNCIPDDHIKSFEQIKQISAQKTLAETDPDTARNELKKIKGRIVFLPLYFLEDQESIIPVGANREAVLPVKLWT